MYFDTFWIRVLMFFYLILRRFRFVFASSFINCLTFVSLFASTRYQRKHSWKSERFYNFFWLFEIASEMTEKMLTRSTKRRYELMKRNCFLWEISRTRFAFLSSEKLLWDEWYAITIVISLNRKILLNRGSFFTHRLFCPTNQYFCTIISLQLKVI